MKSIGITLGITLHIKRKKKNNITERKYSGMKVSSQQELMKMYDERGGSKKKP